MKRSYWYIAVVVTVLQAVNLYFYLQLSKFRDFDEVGYHEIFIDTGVEKNLFAIQANVYIPFEIINLSNWMPYHTTSSLIHSGMNMYSVSFRVKGDNLITGERGFNFPVDFMNNNPLDMKLIAKHARDIPEITGKKNGSELPTLFAKHFLNMRGFVYELVYVGRIAYICMLNAIILIFFGVAWYIYHWSKRAALKKRNVLREAYEYRSKLCAILTDLQPRFDRAWLIVQHRSQLVHDAERMLHKKVYALISLAVRDREEFSVTQFASEAKKLGSEEILFDAERFISKVNEWFLTATFEEERNLAKKKQLASAHDEFLRHRELFARMRVLATNREFCKIYREAERTLTLIEVELSKSKVHEKRFAFIREALKDLQKGLITT